MSHIWCVDDDSRRWVMAHTSTSSLWCLNISLSFRCVVHEAWAWMSYITFMNELHHMYEWVVSCVRMICDTHASRSRSRSIAVSSSLLFSLEFWSQNSRCAAEYSIPAAHYSGCLLEHRITHVTFTRPNTHITCNTLQHTATHCNTLQHANSRHIYSPKHTHVWIHTRLNTHTSEYSCHSAAIYFKTITYDFFNSWDMTVHSCDMTFWYMTHSCTHTHVNKWYLERDSTSTPSQFTCSCMRHTTL